MTIVRICDATTTMGKPRFIKDGYMTALVRVARAGVQDYTGRELGKPDMDRVRLYRPSTAVFDSKAIKSYAHRPITNDHPPEDVTADNWKKHAVGVTGQEVLRDGDFVAVPVMIMDSKTIEDTKSGKREWSMGLDAEIEFVSGIVDEDIADKGKEYDAIMRVSDINHLALVHAARGGEELRLGDSRNPEKLEKEAQQPNGGHQMAGENLKVVIVDGLSISTTELGSQVIERLQRQLKDSGANVEMMTQSHAKELAAKDAEIKTLRDAAVTPEQLQKLVDARSALLADAARLAPDADFKGKTDAEIRAGALAVKLGDAAIAGKDAHYVAAMFDIQVKDAAAIGGGSGDAFRDAVHTTRVADAKSDPNGQQAYENRLAEAWRTPAGKA